MENLNDINKEQNKEYKVLARKYRPTEFSGLIGQESMVRTLSNAITTGRIAHAFILTGIRGIGKTTTARIIARSLNCVGKDGRGGPTITPCGVCHNCLGILQGRHTDILEMDAASRTGVDDIREIIESANYKPVSARFKIYIIDEVHMLSRNAFNALLKTLEEPPPHVKFIFATTEIRKIPVTILSRCMRFDLRRLSNSMLVDHLTTVAEKETISVDKEALVLIASVAEGSVRDALSLLDQAISHSADKVSVEIVTDMLGLADKTKVMDLFAHIVKGEAEKALAVYEEIYNHGGDVVLIMQDLLGFINLITKSKLLKQDDVKADIPESYWQRAKLFAPDLDVGYLASLWQMLLKGIGEVKIAHDAYMAGQMLLVRMLYMADLPTPAKIIDELTTGKIPTMEVTAGNMSGAKPLAVSSDSPTVKTVHSNVQTPAPVAKLASMSYMGGAAVDVREENTADEEAKTEGNIIYNFEQLVELFKQNDEIFLYNLLYSEVNLVNFESGRIEISTAPIVPKDFAGKISDKLKTWTKTRWTVIISSAKGEASLAKKQQEMEEKKKQEAVGITGVKQIVENFPGAKVVRVKDIKKPCDN